jgi:hypothetical protein
MAEEVTGAQVQQKRNKVAELREKVRAEYVKRAAEGANAANTLKLAQLDNEEERLRAELDALRQSNKEAPKIVKQQVQAVANPEPVLVNPSTPVVENDKEGEK